MSMSAQPATEDSSWHSLEVDDVLHFMAALPWSFSLPLGVTCSRYMLTQKAGCRADSFGPNVQLAAPRTLGLLALL